MKKLYVTIYILLLLTVVVSSVILILSPDVIPAHYNAAFEVDRYGSKYETLILPCFSIAITVFLLLIIKHQESNKITESSKRIVLISAIFMQVLFICLSIFFGITAINYNDNSSLTSSDVLLKLISIVSGSLFIILGSLIPKVGQNAWIGIRTKWSMANEIVWHKSQTFGGITAVIAGIAIILFALILPGIWNLMALTLIVIIWLIACLYVSYRYAKNI